MNYIQDVSLTQVNTEVKRLLIASVGEDIEAKVDFLTQVRMKINEIGREMSNQNILEDCVERLNTFSPTQPELGLLF